MYSHKWNCYFLNMIIMFCLPVPTLICEKFTFLGLVCLYSAAGKYVHRSWEYINRSQTHKCGNWDWGRTIPRKGIHKWDFPCSVGICRFLLTKSLRSVPATLWDFKLCGLPFFYAPLHFWEHTLCTFPPALGLTLRGVLYLRFHSARRITLFRFPPFLGLWIRIKSVDPDLGGQKLPQKMKKTKNFHVFKCWMFYLRAEGFSVALASFREA
jgi:hypothetical protein